MVLYELLTGKRLFQGEDVGHTLASVIMQEPDLSAAPAEVLPLLKRCLEKDPKKRLRDIGDAWALLAEPAAIPAAPLPSRFGWTAWAVAAAAILMAAGVSLVHFRETAPALPPGRFGITLPGSQQLFLRLSPDGRNLAFIIGNQPRIWVRPLDSLEARQIPGTEGALFPFWSYDGENLGFFAQGKLKKIALAGGPAQTLCDAPTGRGGTWNREGVIVFTPDIGGSLYRVSADGGAPTQLTKQGRYPEFIQGGGRFLFESDTGTESPGLFVGSLDGTAPVRILPDVSRGVYVPPPVGGGMGHLLFRREGTLMALPFDAEKLAARGGAVPLAENVPNSGTVGYGGFAASENGVLLYVSGSAASNQTLTWLDRSGKRLESKAEPRAYAGMALAPDGKRAAVSVGTSLETSDLWLQNLERGVPAKFTFNGFSGLPVWSPDGNFIAFSNRKRLQTDLYRKASNGGGAEELLLHVGPNGFPTDISPDGKWLVYSETNGKTKEDLWLLPLTGEHKPVKYLDSPFSEIQAQFSPDGKWMAYRSDESGQNQVYVQPVPATGAKRQVSTGGGSRPRWRRDGKEIFYISAESKLMAVPASLGPSGFDFGVPRQLFDNALPPIIAFGFGYQPSADGQKFLAILPEEGATSAASSVTVQMNWQAGLKK